MISTVLVNAHADYGRDFHPPANHLTQLRNFTKGEFVLIFYSFLFTSTNDTPNIQ